MLAEIELDHARQVAIHGLVVGDAGAERIGKHHPAGADDRQQTRYSECRLRVEGERIHESIVDPAIDDVDLDRAFGGAHPHIAVAHEEIAAFDQLDAHLLGEEHVLEISAVVAAWREQHDHGSVGVARRNGAQVFQQALGIIADRHDRLAREGIGKEPHHDLAVLEHIGDARRRAHIVLEHEEIALAGADQVDAGDMRIDIARRLDAEHLGAKGRVRQHELRRHEARLDDLLVVIDVVEEDVDRLHPLNAAALDKLPFGAGEDTRDQVEGDQPLGRAAIGIDGESDAEAAKQLLRSRDVFGRLSRCARGCEQHDAEEPAHRRILAHRPTARK